MKALTPFEHKTLASLAPTREVYGKPPLPIEILAAGGPKALREYLKNLGASPTRRRVKP